MVLEATALPTEPQCYTDSDSNTGSLKRIRARYWPHLGSLAWAQFGSLAWPRLGPPAMLSLDSRLGFSFYT